MRRARITYEGAYHHAMNRGYDGLPIFKESSDKKIFLNLVKKNRLKCKVAVHAYCLMDNHYHMVIQNRSGRMSDFFKRVNGEFGSIYRKKYGGSGYVFQSRFKSTLVQDDAYLMMVIAYVLNNPVSAKMVKRYLDYPWSSGEIYFSNTPSEIIENAFIRDVFKDQESFSDFVNSIQLDELPTIQTETGPIIGGDGFYIKALEKYDRRKKQRYTALIRKEDYEFDPVEKVFREFEKQHQISIEKIDTTSYSGKRKRADLLVRLKDQGGLTYPQIKKLDIFDNVRLNSLGRMYRDAKLKEKDTS